MKKETSYLNMHIKLIFKTAKLGIPISFFLMILTTILSILLPELIRRIIDNGIFKKSINKIIILSAIYIFILLITNIISMGLDNYFGTLKLRVSKNLKMLLLKRLAKSKGKYLSSQETGNILRILDNDIFQVESFGIDLLLNFVLNAVTAVIVFIILLNYNMILLSTLIVIQLIMFIIQSKIAKKVTENIKKVREIAGQQSNLQEQFVSNIKGIILANAADYCLNIFYKKQEKFIEKSKKVNFSISFHAKFASTFSTLSSIFTYLIGGVMIVYNKMSFGELLAFLEYISLLIAPCMFFISSNIKIKQTNVSLEKIYKEMEKIEEIKEKKDCLHCVEHIKEIQFKDVYFKYLEKTILNNLSLRLLCNEVTAIVGESGCGKSTLLSLLYRLWEPDKGEIYINNKKIGDYSLSSLRKKICIVSQDALIFNDDIEENIKMNSQYISTYKINNICNVVGLSSLIKSTHEIGNTNIGERGSKLSGGQKQRVAIARALVTECDVLILDESTSALDNISQKKLLENIEPFFKEKIVIIIAHRMSSIKCANKIIVMREGTIVEAGNHNTLMEKRGIYYMMTSLT